MRAEYWAIAAVLLAITEVVAPGVFLIFFAVGAFVTALAALVFPLLWLQLIIFAVASLAAIAAGHSFYRRRMLARHAANGLGKGPVGEPGVVEEPIVNGRGKVRVRDISWLATGPDLGAGTPVVVTARQGTMLVVTAR